MDDKIEIGEYVRLDRNQGINKIVDITQDGLYELDEIIGDEWGNETYIIGNEDIVKHSKNIIELLEVGDLIELRGAEKLKYEVLKISYSPSKGTHIHIINPFRTEGGKDIFIEDIQSIVTKEQFESTKYNLEEK